jgi:hypothetical protein
MDLLNNPSEALCFGSAATSFKVSVVTICFTITAGCILASKGNTSRGCLFLESGSSLQPLVRLLLGTKDQATRSAQDRHRHTTLTRHLTIIQPLSFLSSLLFSSLLCSLPPFAGAVWTLPVSLIFATASALFLWCHSVSIAHRNSDCRSTLSFSPSTTFVGNFFSSFCTW